jgi:hypothetical protein
MNPLLLVYYHSSRLRGPILERNDITPRAAYPGCPDCYGPGPHPDDSRHYRSPNCIGKCHSATSKSDPSSSIAS